MDGRVLTFLGVASVVLAGCTQPPDDIQEIVVDSRQATDETVAVSGGAPRAHAVHAGDLAGVVVDPAIVPIEGAVVRLPGLELQRRTGDEGTFGFIDLVAGPYRLTAEAPGYRPLDSLVDVKAGTVTQVRVVLERDPSLEPYHQTHDYRGHAEVAGEPYTSQSLGGCSACSFRLFLEEPAQTLVLEAARIQDPGQLAQGMGMRWWVEVRDGEGQRLSAEYGPEPYYLRLDPGTLGNATMLRLEVRPLGFPLPEASVDFQVYATAFHHQPAPAGWSFVGGDR